MLTTAEHRGDEARAARAPLGGVSDPSTGPRATPAFVAAESQPSALARSSGSRRVGDVGLDHAHRPAARALHDAREEEQQPERKCANAKMTYAIARRGEADEQRRPSSVAVGEAAPHRRAEELRDRERADEHARPTQSARARATSRRRAGAG